MEREAASARCLAGIGRYDDSLDELEQAAAAADTAGDTVASATANIERGNIYVRLGQPRDALRVLSRVFELPKQPGLAPLLFVTLADAYTELGDWQRAEDMSDAAGLFVIQVYGQSADIDPIGYRLTAERKLAIARLAARTGRHRRALYVLDGIEIGGVFGANSYLVERAARPQFATRLEALMPEVDLQAGDSLAAHR